MARTVTLGKLRGLARLYADQRPADETNAFVNAVGTTTTAGVNDLINLAVGEFYDLLIKASGGDFNRTSADLAIVAGTSLYNLPATYYQGLAVELHWAAQDVEPVDQMATSRDRWKFLNLNSWGSWSPKAFRRVGAQVEILPVPTSAVTARLWFVPVFTDLTADADTVNGVNGWEKLIALKVAMELREIEESPPGQLPRMFEAEKERIEGLIADLNPGPAQVVDVMPEMGMTASWPGPGGRVTT